MIEDYEPILQAILFCVVYIGLTPRLAKERSDSGESRLDKIRELIESSQYSIHDLSRCQAAQAGEHYRLNMPFELGIDYGCKRYLAGCEDKRTLILEEQPYRYQAAISDLAGWDIQHHDGNIENAVRKVRHWFATNVTLKAIPSPPRILGAYADFQAWNYERLLNEGWSQDDILEYPTNELLAVMQDWMARGSPAR
ncbi:MAG: hypothetical protein AcusKO_28210 [Acuticoccus sp.]